MKDSSQDTLNSLHFTTLKYKWREKEIKWRLNSSPSHSPGCFNLIFNFKCSQSSVDCVHDLISLVTTSSAIKASYYNVFCACKVSSPVESEDSICFLTTGACISVKNPKLLAFVVFLNQMRSACISIPCGQEVYVFLFMSLKSCQPPGVSTMGPLKLGNMTIMAVCFLQRGPSVLSLKTVIKHRLHRPTVSKSYISWRSKK